MFKSQRILNINDIEFKVKYSRRRSIGISVLPDSAVIVRVPYLTSLKTINRIVEEKSEWIIKHRDNYREKVKSKTRSYIDGELHLFRGIECVLKIGKSKKKYVRFLEGIIETGLEKNDDPLSIKRLLYQGYKNEAEIVFPGILKTVLSRFEEQGFKPSGLIIRTMKRRWGSCSNKGIITLSTELIKLHDIYIEYVIIHELCHLKHHNHGAGFYKLLSELSPEWKEVRKNLKAYIQ